VVFGYQKKVSAAVMGLFREIGLEKSRFGTIFLFTLSFFSLPSSLFMLPLFYFLRALNKLRQNFENSSLFLFLFHHYSGSVPLYLFFKSIKVTTKFGIFCEPKKGFGSFFALSFLSLPPSLFKFPLFYFLIIANKLRQNLGNTVNKRRILDISSLPFLSSSLFFTFFNSSK
jgi:hypothetical protein